MSLPPAPSSRARASHRPGLGARRRRRRTAHRSAAHANTAGPGLVINEVYGGGGNAGATLNERLHRARATPTPRPISRRRSEPAVPLGRRHDRHRPTSSRCPSVDLPAGQTTWSRARPAPTGTSAADPGRDQHDQPVAAPVARSTSPTGTTGDRPRHGEHRRTRRRRLRRAGAALDDELRDRARGPATTQHRRRSTRDAPGADTNNNTADFTLAGPPTPVACGSACGATPPPPPTAAHDRRDPGHRRDLAAGRRRPVDHPGRRDRGVPDRRLLRLRPPDRRHRQRRRRHAGRLRRDLRPPALGRGDRARSATYVEVTGAVSEFSGLTELSVDAADVHDLGTPPLGGGDRARRMAYPTTTGRTARLTRAS